MEGSQGQVGNKGQEKGKRKKRKRVGILIFVFFSVNNLILFL